MWQTLQPSGFSVSPRTSEPTSAELQSSIFWGLCRSNQGLLKEGLEPDFFSLSDVSALNNIARISSAGDQQYQVIGKGALWPLG